MACEMSLITSQLRSHKTSSHPLPLLSPCQNLPQITC